MIRMKYEVSRAFARFSPRRILALLGFKGLLKALEVKLLRTGASTYCYNLPDTVYLEITNRCQLRCRYCYRLHPDLMNPAQGFMSFDDFTAATEHFRGVRRLYLSMGGEPALHRDIVRMLQYVRDNRIARTFGFVSNGMLLTPDIADGILKTGPDFIDISFDSPDADVIEAIRVGTDFKVLTDNIRYLTSRAAPETRIEINTVITSENLESLGRMPELLHDLGVRCLRTQQMMVRTSDTAELRSAEPHELVTLLAGKCRELGIEFHYDPMLPKTVCMWPFRSVGVTWDGKITPCCYIETVGLNDTPFDFTGMWNGKKMRAWRRNMLTMEYPEICHKYCTFVKEQ